MLRRKGGFSARIFIPAELQQLIGRREVWRSTQTDDVGEAKLRESLWQHHFQTLFLRLAMAGSSMAQDQLSAIVAEYLDARLEEVEERLALDLPGLDDASRDMWQDGIIEKIEAVELQLIEGDYSQTSAQAAQMLPKGSDVAIAVLSRRLLEAQYDALRAELNAMQGKPLRRARIVAKASVPADDTEVPPQVSPRVSQVCSEYIDTTGTSQRWSTKTYAARRQGANLLMDFLDDCPIGEVTKARMTEAYKLLPRMPVRYDKRYRALAAHLMKTYRDRKDVSAALQWLGKMLSMSPEDEAGVELARLRDAGVSADEMFCAALSIYAFHRDRPRSLPEDARLTFALGRAIVRLRKRRRVFARSSLRMQTFYVSPKAFRYIGLRIREALPVLFTRLMEMHERARQEEADLRWLITHGDEMAAKVPAQR